MKKIIAVLVSVCLAACVFAACSNKTDDKIDQNETGVVVSTSTITTDEAKIIDSDAIKLIKSYSPEELSLTQEQYDNCSFMVSSSGIEVQGDYYVEVIATIKEEHQNDDGTVSYTFDNQGEYFIRYDGKQILKRDVTAAEEDAYEEMEVKEVPTTASDSAEETTAE